MNVWDVENCGHHMVCWVNLFLEGCLNKVRHVRAMVKRKHTTSLKFYLCWEGWCSGFCNRTEQEGSGWGRKHQFGTFSSPYASAQKSKQLLPLFQKSLRPSICVSDFITLIAAYFTHRNRTRFTRTTNNSLLFPHFDPFKCSSSPNCFMMKKAPKIICFSTANPRPTRQVK